MRSAFLNLLSPDFKYCSGETASKKRLFNTYHATYFNSALWTKNGSLKWKFSELQILQTMIVLAKLVNMLATVFLKFCKYILHQKRLWQICVVLNTSTIFQSILSMFGLKLIRSVCCKMRSNREFIFVNLCSKYNLTLETTHVLTN